MAANVSLFGKIIPQVCLLGTGWVLCLPSPRKSFKDPGLKFQHFPVLRKEGCPCRLGGCPPTGQWPPESGNWPCMTEGSLRKRTTPADPVWFWERAQCSLPLTLALREAEEQAWATLGWFPNRPVNPAQLPRSQFPILDSLGSQAQGRKPQSKRHRLFSILCASPTAVSSLPEDRSSS